MRNRQFFKIALSIFIIVLLIAITQFIISRYVDNIYDEITALAEDLILELNKMDHSASEKIFADLKNKWNKHADILPVIIDHNDIDVITFSIYRLDSYISSYDKTLSLAETKALIAKLDSIKLREKLTITNIF